MSTSRDSGNGLLDRFVRFSRDGFPNPTRYDALLALIPLALLATLFVHVLTGVSMHLAIAGGSMVGMVALADALWLNPPSRPGGG